MNSINFLNLEYILFRIVDFFQNFDIIAILNFLIYWITMLKPIAFVISLFLIFVIVYARIRLGKVEKAEDAKFHSVRLKDALANEHADPVVNKKWQSVEAHMATANPSDWRLAIIEADIMLGDLLEKMGYQGDSIGEKMKGIEKSDFVTLDLAWEAHKVRNLIAHEGNDYLLNERDAKRAIECYKKVFQEFGYI